MSRYVKLESEKYLQYSAESKHIRRFKNRVAIRALVALLAGVALLPAAIYVGEHIHIWTPIADAWLTEVSGGKFQFPRLNLPIFG